ncbi:SGNH/GDSL hydrolase family protein [archaeon]|nr:SGNH/GDSL hydrolase family protein [archaeon]NDB78649.1 SGNH/GDSL hydrolase family protein [archaeon]
MSNHIIILLGILALLLIWLLYGFRSLGELPLNNPKTYLKNKRDDGKEIVVLIGDSLTHGNVQPSWVNSMRKKMGEDFEFINAGINGETTNDVLNRINEILACDPNIATLLIGNNNLMGSFERNERNYKKSKQVEWSINGFENEYRMIVKRLIENDIKLAVSSLMSYGEEIGCDEFERTREYSKIIKKIADEFSLYYIPLFEEIEKYLIEKGGNRNLPKIENDSLIMLQNFMIKKILLKQSWDKISTDSRFKVTLDHIHFNNYSANLMESMVSEFIKSK